MVSFHYREILFRLTIQNPEIRRLGQEGEVGDRIYLWPAVLALIQNLLGKDVVDLQCLKMPQQMTGKLDSGLPISGLADPSKQIKQRVERAPLLQPAKSPAGV